MKSITNPAPGKEIKYPCLMALKNMPEYVVLFKSAGVGTIVADPNNNNLGFYSALWDMTTFAPYNGEIILSNETN
jgi:hypothetical protein